MHAHDAIMYFPSTDIQEVTLLSSAV